MRERFAGLLHKAGALGALMQLRRWAPVHTLPIVTYHHVADQDPAYPYDPDVADATRSQFREQMEWIAKYCTPIGVDELIRAVDGEPLPKAPVMVTFDDGYKSCHDVALPILRAVGVRATFFVATKFIQERQLYWWERIALVLSRAERDVGYMKYPEPRRIDRRDGGRQQLIDLVKDTASLDIERFLDELCAAFHVEWSRDIERASADELIMTWDDIRALSRAGMDIASHGRTHRVLQTLDEATLVEELVGSRRDLEAELNRPVQAIAYPVGRRISAFPHIVKALESAGYRVGLTNKGGVNRIWPAPLNRRYPLGRWDIARLATDRVMSHEMFTMQVAIPRLAYQSKHNSD